MALKAYSLTHEQQEIWLQQQRVPKTALFNIGGRLTAEGPLDVEVLRRAVGRVIEESDALRLRLVRAKDGVAQRADAPVSPPLVVDLSGLEGAEARAQDLMARELGRPFETDGQALCRFLLLRVGAERHHLLAGFHHLILDGVGVALFGRRIAAWYEALSTSGSSASPSPSALPSFLDLVATNGGASSNGASTHGAATNGAGRVAPEVPEAPLFPPLRQAPTSHHLRVSLRGWQLDPIALPRLLPAALALLLERQHHRHRFLLGVATHNRRNAREKQILGLFVSLMPLEVEVQRGDSGGALVEAVGKGLRRGYRQRRRGQGGDHGPRKFEVALSYEPQAYPLHLGRARAEVLAMPSGSSPHPLSVTVRGERIDLEGQRAFFDRSSLGRFGRRLRRALVALTQDPDGLLADLDLLGRAERQQLLVEWNEPSWNWQADELAPDGVRRQIATAPEAVAVVEGERYLSYGGLDRGSRSLARRLQDAGVERGGGVAVFLERSAEQVVALLGILRAGAAYLPLDPEAPAARLLFQLTDATIPAVVTQRSLKARLPKTSAHIVEVDAAEDLGLGKRGFEAETAEGEATAYVIYTSGSTGLPKGVDLSHRALAGLIGWHRRTYDVGPGDRATWVASPSFDASVWEIWPALCAGATLSIPSAGTVAVPSALRDFLTRERVTLSFLPTPLAEALFAEESAPRLPAPVPRYPPSPARGRARGRAPRRRPAGRAPAQ